MQLYFIRHAQSANNKLYDETGAWNGRDVDPELTEIGQRQAKHLAEHLACTHGAGATQPRDYANRQAFGITHLYTSPMVRAVSTATYLSEALGLPLTMWEDLHEIGGIFRVDENGERQGLPGKTRSDFAARFPDVILPQALGEDGWWNRPPESIEQQLDRAQRVVRDLSERHGQTDDRVVAVSHGGFYNFVLTALLGTTPGDGFWFGINNTGITRLDFSAEGIALMYANRLEHLSSELIT